MASGSAVARDGVVGPMAEGLGVPTQGHNSLTENDDEMLACDRHGEHHRYPARHDCAVLCGVVRCSVL
jgi:hypothetical protein